MVHSAPVGVEKGVREKENTEGNNEIKPLVLLLSNLYLLYLATLFLEIYPKLQNIMLSKESKIKLRCIACYGLYENEV